MCWSGAVSTQSLNKLQRSLTISTNKKPVIFTLRAVRGRPDLPESQELRGAGGHPAGGQGDRGRGEEERDRAVPEVAGLQQEGKEGLLCHPSDR